MARKAQVNNKASFVNDHDTDLDDDQFSDLDDRLEAQSAVALAGRAPSRGIMSSDDLATA